MVELDKFSNLPDDIIDIILSRIPLRAAVQTSILSRAWRFHWTRIERLVLDSAFFNEVLDYGKDDKMLLTTYIRIVNKIILPHNGPVRKFFLSIPNVLIPDPSIISSWILKVSKCGVQDLGIKFEGGEVHECLLDVLECIELQHLSLECVAVEPLSDFRKFSFLVSLHLFGNDIPGGVLTNIISNCPMLENLSLVYENIKVECGPVIVAAPKLKSLSVRSFDIFYFILKNTPNISSFTMKQMGYTVYPKEASNGCRCVVAIFGSIPRVETITLNADVMEEWDKKDVPKGLPVPLQSHKFFCVRGLELFSPGQLRLLFCLIRSSPKLQSLEISIGRPEACPRASMAYLESEYVGAVSIYSLKTIVLSHPRGILIEIIFIKVILALCPYLEKLYLIGHGYISSKQENWMLAYIKKLHLASTQLDIIYRKGE